MFQEIRLRLRSARTLKLQPRGGDPSKSAIKMFLRICRDEASAAPLGGARRVVALHVKAACKLRLHFVTATAKFQAL